ncbi:glycosyltransferase family 2 protein [Bacillus alveayuensis]|uniref:glycosyltransferase family 2 protein n=1 Tax=Aeribacillus alveayuensis TaxID=279215 RepID=UPI0005CD9B0D|nr:glycosyltransferase family 2 protein [Bacillus alveayuensis]
MNKYMSTIRISIVTYNSQHLFRSLDHLLESIDDRKVVISIFDNNSSEAYKQKLKEYADRVEIYYNDSNIGFGAGHNKNLLSAKEKYFLIFNPDILTDQHTINVMEKQMNNDKSIALMAPKVLYENGENQYLVRNDISLFDFALRWQPFELVKKIFKKRMEQFENRNLPEDCMTEVKHVSGCFMFIRGDVFKKINGFDDKFFMYFEDYDLSLRVGKLGKVVYNPFVTVVHFWERGSHKNFRLFKIFIKSMIRYFNKWGWRLF